METPEEFILNKEKDLVKVLGRETFLQEKMYFVEEVEDFMQEYAEKQKIEILKKFGLGPDGKVLSLKQ